MRTAEKVIFLVRDDSASPILEALHPNPNSCLRRTTEVSFDLSLKKYGINDRKASGKVVDFVDDHGLPQVSFRSRRLRMLLAWIIYFFGRWFVFMECNCWLHQAEIVSILFLESYEAPVAACAVNEVLSSIIAENCSNLPTFIIPFIAKAPKSSLEMEKSMSDEQNVAVFGAQIGPVTDFTESALKGIQKLLPSFQISSEPLACLLHFIRIFKLPALLLVGSSNEHQNQKPEALFRVGETLASCMSLCFLKGRIIIQNPMEKSKSSQEPWRALYG